MSTITSTLDKFADQKTVVLTTYRRDGTPVDTPVHIAVDRDRVFIRTYESAYKTRRLRRRPEAALRLASNGTWPVLVALLRPRDAHPVGVPVRVHAIELAGEESQLAAAALARKYPVLHGVLIPRMHRLMGTRTVNVELAPVVA